MAVKVNTVDILQKYFSAVVKRADHHAPFVNNIIYSLLGIIVLKKDVGADIEVRGSHEDETGNILWVTINGNRHAIRYEHQTGEIEIRRDTYNGPVELTINNNTTTQDILTAVEQF